MNPGSNSPSPSRVVFVASMTLQRPDGEQKTFVRVFATAEAMRAACVADPKWRLGVDATNEAVEFEVEGIPTWDVPRGIVVMIEGDLYS